MLEVISIKELSMEDKVMLLRELGYSWDGKNIRDSDGKIVKDEYANVPVTIDNMLILPGSIKILDNNPLSVASYLEDYPDAF